MMQAVRDDDITGMAQHPETRKLSHALPASPTTPFHFGFGRRTDEDATAHTIQLQVVNYMNHLGAQRSIIPSNPPPSRVLCSASSSIALLQQRFQRLERDKELRYAKKLDAAQREAPQFLDERREVLEAWRIPPCDKEMTIFPILASDDKAAASYSTSRSRINSSSFSFHSCDQPEVLSSTTPYPDRPRETRYFLQNWHTCSSNDNSSTGSRDLPDPGMDEIDTSLHL